MNTVIFTKIKNFFYVYDAKKLADNFLHYNYSKGITNNYIIQRLNPKDFRRLYKVYFKDMNINSRYLDEETKKNFRYVFYKFAKNKKNIERAQQAYAMGCIASITHPSARFKYNNFKPVKPHPKLAGFERVILEYLANKFVIDNVDSYNNISENNKRRIRLHDQDILIHLPVIQKRIDNYIEQVAPNY